MIPVSVSRLLRWPQVASSFELQTGPRQPVGWVADLVSGPILHHDDGCGRPSTSADRGWRGEGRGTARSGSARKRQLWFVSKSLV